MECFSATFLRAARRAPARHPRAPAGPQPGSVELKPEVVEVREIVRRTCDDYRDTFLFEPFAQIDQGQAKTGGGLGLGLSLVKGLVEMHEERWPGRAQGRGTARSSW